MRKPKHLQRTKIGRLLTLPKTFFFQPIHYLAGFFLLMTLGNISVQAQVQQTQIFNFTGANQVFNVPIGVTSLTITAIGADGGDGSNTNGGSGATMIGTVAVSPGNVLNVIVGGVGESGSPTGGGGGGSGVFNTNTTAVLIAAGAGGGGDNSSMGGGGVITTNGGIGVGPGMNGAGGIGGNGGGSGFDCPNMVARSGGGGGVNSAGTNGLSGGGGAGIPIGGAGGIGNSGSIVGGYGFGGGGGGGTADPNNGAPGGGGGFSGGGGASGCGGGSGGGGSFLAAGATGVTMTPGVLSGSTRQNGQIIIRYIVPLISSVPTMSEWGLLIFGLLMMNLGVFFIHKKELIESIQ